MVFPCRYTSAGENARLPFSKRARPDHQSDGGFRQLWWQFT